MAGKKNIWPLVGGWAFLAGLAIAVLAGVFAPSSAIITLVLGVIGLVIGVINVSDKEIVEFLVAAIAFTVAAGSFASVLQSLPGAGLLGGTIPAILGYFVAVVAPAAAVVSLKALYEISHSA